ncbi:ADP-ribose pyrophosphatase YjhB, NUDIX family [Actinomyces ruminicola]|uniref:ADP-ribose pyrophosphatase YjhB, NUDIX family n=1 Tax=Actinomyces ruminicola TaxID=332524 RepID=A0A1H0DCM2_9ACTO|nr:NUDIX domain-containing protein [Actinomyces ruminicola]SDN67925.1 ADP-ribose pyrophosphatase YjhB, NUDIX family [Actinomyces ruminicola]
MPALPLHTGPDDAVPGVPAAPFALVPAAYVLLLRPRQDADLTAPGAAGTEVLLQLRRNTGFMDGHWAAGIAGHVEPGESVTAAAVREGAEELGVVVDPVDLAPLTAMHRSNAVGGPALEQRVDFFFTLTRWRGRPTIQEPDKSGGLAWFALGALPEPIPPHELAALRLLTGALDGGRPVPAITTFGFAGD